MNLVVNNSIAPAGVTLIPAMDFFKSIGVGRTRAYQYLNKGIVPAVKVGTRTMLRPSDAAAFVQNLPVYGARRAT